MALPRITALLCASRPLPLLLAVALAIRAGYALSILPLALVAGTSDFWMFPAAAFGRDPSDMAQVEIGYLALTKTAWTLPLLYTPLVSAPEGVNIFWLDAVPWVSLLGRLVATLTGATPNLIGLFLLACLALPGAAMTMLLAAAGARSLAAAIAGSLIAEATPYLLFRWGHVPHSAHFCLMVALALYVVHRRHPNTARLAVAWAALLPFVLLTNAYLFAMACACWGAALLQRLIDRSISVGRAAGECACVAAAILLVMILTGILSSDLGSAESGGFGWWSMNLLSPVVPQMSGLFPWLRNYRIGMPGQYEGFAWLGGGVLFLGVLTARAWLRWLRTRGRAHLVLLLVLALCFLFALSNRVYAGTHLLLDLELPRRIVLMLGTFRSSGRFFWPIGYAFAAGSIVLTLRTYRPVTAVALLAVAAVLQVIDVEPLRSAVAAATTRPAAAPLDRAAAAGLVARAREVKIFPSYSCAEHIEVTDAAIRRVEQEMLRLNLEFQMLAVRQDRPINSVYSARPHHDCAAEFAEMRQRLLPGVLYVYLVDYQPTVSQMGDATLMPECATTGNYRYCLIPNR